MNDFVLASKNIIATGNTSGADFEKIYFQIREWIAEFIRVRELAGNNEVTEYLNSSFLEDKILCLSKKDGKYSYNGIRYLSTCDSDKSARSLVFRMMSQGVSTHLASIDSDGRQLSNDLITILKGAPAVFVLSETPKSIWKKSISLAPAARASLPPPVDFAKQKQRQEFLSALYETVWNLLKETGSGLSFSTLRWEVVDKLGIPRIQTVDEEVADTSEELFLTDSGNQASEFSREIPPSLENPESYTSDKVEPAERAPHDGSVSDSDFEEAAVTLQKVLSERQLGILLFMLKFIVSNNADPDAVDAPAPQSSIRVSSQMIIQKVIPMFNIGKSTAYNELHAIAKKIESVCRNAEIEVAAFQNYLISCAREVV